MAHFPTKAILLEMIPNQVGLSSFVIVPTQLTTERPRQEVFQVLIDHFREEYQTQQIY